MTESSPGSLSAGNADDLVDVTLFNGLTRQFAAGAAGRAED
jgi:hypothetical protein